jgi:four helix bundle protein
MTNYKTLILWQKAMLLVKEVYLLARGFPKEETFGLTSQIKRAATSVPANVAEGCGRRTSKDTVQFLHIARGSLYELDTLLAITVTVEIITENHLNTINLLMEECLKLVNGLIAKHSERGN